MFLYTIYSYNIVTNNWFTRKEIFYKRYIDNKAHIERLMATEYWIYVEIVCDINEENIMYLSTKSDIKENVFAFYCHKKRWFKGCSCD